MKPRIQTLGLFLSVSAILLGFGAWYYLERMTHLDMAFQTFLILKSGHLEIQSGRFGAAVTQVWPLAAQWMGLPLKGVLFAYSIGHAAWPVLLASLAWVWGQWRWSMVILLSATLLTTHTFFWLSEMPQGLVFLCAVYAWMHYKGSFSRFKWWEWGLWLAALWTAFYFHPMVLYANLFIGLFFLLEPGRDRGWKIMHVAAMGLFIGLAVLKYKVLKLDWYDAAAIKRQDAFGQLWPHWLDIDSNHQFLAWSIQDYWLVWLVIFGGIIWAIRQHRFTQAAFMALWPLGFVLLVNVPFHDSIGKQFYMENLYLPLAVYAAVPLMFLVFNQPKEGLSNRAFWVLFVLFGLSFWRISQAAKEWNLRLRWERQLLQTTHSRPLKKLIIQESQVPMDLLKMSWGSPYEFLLLSALEHPDSARCVIITDQPSRYDSLMSRPALFLGTFKNYPFESLPSQYFGLKDTSGYVKYESK
ncbi:MAG TPA: hypothetical protein DCF33_10935 [Saprospirales bacterium]|nr:hypothetical protein [Saprospirales bacterium]